MPNDDLIVGRCEALSDANVMPLTFGALGTVMPPPSNCTPIEGVEWQIKHAEKQAKTIQAKLDALYALRAKLSDPECAKAVQTALELLR